MKNVTISRSLMILAFASIWMPALRADDCYANTIFVPRQMAYNPMYEHALVFDEYAHMDYYRFLISVKPIYNQTVGSSLNTYFNINRSCSMSVREDGSGDIDSLWFQVISAPDTFYASTLSFSPVQKTYGAMFYFAYIMPMNFAITINTAFVERSNNMHICESNIVGMHMGELSGFATVSQSLASNSRWYGKICGSQSKGGVDDIQVKVLKNFTMCEDESLFWDVYALVGIPTGKGSKAEYLFEPLIGSKHAQFGLGLNTEKSWEVLTDSRFSLYGELKWRYAFKGKETRVFDMAPNGQWSRYMLFTTPAEPAVPFFAINNLAFQADVTPRNSFDLLFAGHLELTRFSFELGYNLWYRQAETVCPCINLCDVGVADLVGIAKLNSQTPGPVTTASTATISQSVYPNQYQMRQDAAYTLVTAKNINACSGAQGASFANAVFGSIGYHHDRWVVGINTSYEHAGNDNTPSVVSVWVNLDVRF